MLDKLRYQLYRTKYNYGRHLKLKVPVDVMLELSSRCNLQCSYCYHSDPKKVPFTKGHMSKDLAFKVIKEAADLGVSSIKTNYRGESTLNPAFKIITDYARLLADGSTFIDRITNSNFQFKNERDDIFKGLCNQTKVKVSFDSFNSSVFEAQRLRSDHSLIVRNIDTFYNYPRRSSELVIQAVRTTANKDEDIEYLAKRRWPGAEVSVRDMVAGRTNDTKDLEHKKRDFSERLPCKQAFVRLIVHQDGLVGPCCPDIKDELPIGNVNTQSLDEIFNGLAAIQLRKDLISGAAFKNNPCASCSSFESYRNYTANWDS